MIQQAQTLKASEAEAENRVAIPAEPEGSRVLCPSILEQNPNPIVEIGPAGDIRYMNPAASRLFPDLRQRGLAHPWLASSAAAARQNAEGESRTATLEVEIEGRVYQQTLCYAAEEGVLRIFGLDVTERQRAEDALRQTRDELQAIYDAMVDGLLIADAETKRFVRANPAIGAMLGYSEEQILSLSVMDIHPREKLPEVLLAFENQVLARARMAEAVPVLRSDGTVFDADISTSLLTYRGRLAVLGIFRDITERRRAEAALRASEERFRGYFAQGLLGMAVTGMDKQWREVNDRLCEILGYSREELLSMKWTEATHPDDVAAGVRQFDRLVAGEIDHFTQDKRFVRKDGGIVHATVFIRCFRRPDGAVDHFLALIEDATERKRVEAALRQSRDELQAIYDHIVDGILVVDRQKVQPVRVNSAYCRMLGYSLEEAYALTPQRVHPPDVLPQVWEHFETLNAGQVARLVDLPFIRKDGTIIFADVVSRPIWYNDRPCWICIFHDVTERKRAQEALAREHRALKRLLQSSDHERQLIAYEIHDGLAQQLAGALMQFETYAYQKDRLPRLAADAFDAGMTMLRQAHFEARRLISGVRPPILDEAGIVAAVAHLVNEERRKGGPTIELHGRVEFERLSPILENAIYRIVQEALNNACQHSKSDRVTVELVQEGETIRIEVRDQGIGFEPDAIGESHFGLAGIRERARLLGGTATVDSSPGQGTRVRIMLPLLFPAKEAPQTPHEEA